MIAREAGVPTMTDAEHARIGTFIEREFGIKMPPNKKSLLEGRLAKRLYATGCRSYGEYFDLVTGQSASIEEYSYFADLVSTHETSFFREAKHFHCLTETLLPALLSAYGRRSISVLSVACSTGEEAYSLAMAIDSVLVRYRREDVTLSVEGVDLSPKAVAIAARGVFTAERTLTIPEELRRRYVMVSKDRGRDLCRIVPELRSCTTFHTGNLFGDLALSRRKYDIVFCRNVLIYFEAARQREVIEALLRHMSAGAYLFLGHSETMHSSGFQIKSLAHAVYQKY
jgi:chemotaxis protein methyltransferase CheR